MNWNLVWWFVGIMGTFTVLKFVIVMFKSLFSKDSMEGLLDTIGDGITNINKRMTKSIKQKAKERKQRKIEERKPIVEIR